MAIYIKIRQNYKACCLKVTNIIPLGTRDFMGKLLKNITYTFFCFITFVLLNVAQATNNEIKHVVEDISKMYISSMEYIFLSQPIINQKGGDKSALFGQKFINNIKTTYQAKFSEPFPLLDHQAKKMLLQTMVEVMEDNLLLVNDVDIGFKGLIPATFAFQISRKLSTKGIGLEIKFTRTSKKIRNPFNKPDDWETKIMAKMLKSPQIYYDENALLNGKPAFRQFTVLQMKPYCLNCHGTIADNPLNTGKPESQWTDIDMTGFKMENWSIDDFGGGVSISIEKSHLQ